MNVPPPKGIEQARRNFMRDQPELYRYIALRESAKALKSAGDNASGALDGHGAANRVWSMAAQASERYEAMQASSVARCCNDHHTEGYCDGSLGCCPACPINPRPAPSSETS